MFKYLYLAIAVILFCICGEAFSYANDTVAFTYFVNNSNNDSYDYLGHVLPKSFSSALRNRYNFKTINPEKFKLTFSDKDVDSSKTAIEINEADLPELTKSLHADYLIFGSFTPKKNNQFKISISLYKVGTQFVFTFEDTGYIEKEIFKLVDRIAWQLKNFMEYPMAYKSAAIKEKSKIAILCNIDGTDLNSLYYEFLKSGYKISMFQGNELYSYLTDTSILKFFQVSSKNASFDYIGDMSLIKLFHGTWSGVKYYKAIIQERDLIKKYTTDYMNQTDQIFNKIIKMDNDLDYIVIIGFDKTHHIAWYRCLDIKNNNLMSLEYGIYGDTINEVTSKIIKNISTPLVIKK